MPERHRDVAVAGSAVAPAAGAARSGRAHPRPGRQNPPGVSCHSCDFRSLHRVAPRSRRWRETRTVGVFRDRCALGLDLRSARLAFSVATGNILCQTFSKTFSIRYHRAHGTPSNDQRRRCRGGRLGLDGLQGRARPLRRRARHDAPRARGRRAARLPVEPRREQHALAPDGRDRGARAGLRAVQRRDPQGRRRRGARHRLRPARLQRVAGRHGRGVGAPLGQPPERHAHRRRHHGHPVGGQRLGRGADRRDRSAHRSRRPADRGIRQLPRRSAGDPLPHRARAHAASASSSGRPDLRSSVLRDAGYRSALLEAGIAFDPALVGRRPLPGGRLARARARPALARRPTDRDLRGERPLGDRGARRRCRTRDSRSPTSSR